MRLHFEAAVVRRLFDHSKAALRRFPTMDQKLDRRYRRDGKDISFLDLIPAAWPDDDVVDQSLIPIGLWLVGDNGIYLLSNGDPPLLASMPDKEIEVAYAAEADPRRLGGRQRDVTTEAFGQDEGVIVLDAAFLEWLLKLAIDGVVCIDLTAQTAAPALPDPGGIHFHQQRS